MAGPGKISRAALGNIAYLGELYDARSDEFCGLSVLKQSLPESALLVRDDHHTDLQYIHTDNFSEKFDKLEVKAELQVSVLAGLFTLKGSARFLQDRKNSARTVKSSLLYNIKTQKERVNIYHIDFKEALSLEAVQNGIATHVVVGISWGASSVLSCIYENVENHDIREIQGELQAQLKKATLAIEGKASVDFQDKDNSKLRKFEIRLYGDILPSNEELPTTVEEATALMRKVPSLVTQSNNGKGRPLSYELIPIKFLQDFLKVQVGAEIVLKSLEEATLRRIVRIFDEIKEGQQRFRDFYQDFLDNLYCVPTEDIQKASDILNAMALEETKLRSKLAPLLINVRAGRCEVSEIENIIKDFQNGENSPARLSAQMDQWADLTEKISFAKLLKKNGGNYIGLRMKLHRELVKDSDKNVMIFFFKATSKTEDSHRWQRNWEIFVNELLKPNNETRLYAVDCDIHHDLMPQGLSCCVQIYKRGIIHSVDYLEELMRKEGRALAKSPLDALKSIHKPTDRIPLKIPCTGRNCKGQEKLDWLCAKCLINIEWGFNGMVYCDCGEVPAFTLEFKCTEPDHGISFDKHEEKYLKLLLSNLKQFEEINLLVIGQNNEIKMNWINAFINFAKFSSYEKAKEQELHQPASLPKKAEVPKVYTMFTDNKIINLIDTSSPNEAGEMTASCKNALNLLSTVKEVHGICIILKEGDMMENELFKYYLQYFLTYLHVEARNNIVFCFSNPKSHKFGMNGKELLKLRWLFENKDKHQVKIPFRQHTIYYFDIKLQNEGDDISEISKEIETSWKDSSEEVTRLLCHFETIRSFKTEDKVLLEDCRKILWNQGRLRESFENKLEVERNEYEDEDEDNEEPPCYHELQKLCNELTKVVTYLKINAILPYVNVDTKYGKQKSIFLDKVNLEEECHMMEDAIKKLSSAALAKPTTVKDIKNVVNWVRSTGILI